MFSTGPHLSSVRAFSRPDHAQTAGMFGELAIENMQRGADVRTVAEWARTAARYGLKALAEQEAREIAQQQVIADYLASDPNVMHRLELQRAHVADVLAYYRRF